MARITIEDCMEQVNNRFQLVQMASIRAKQLKKGARPLLTSEENKEVVMSLREIAAGLVKPGELINPDAGLPGADAGGLPPAIADPSTASGTSASTDAGAASAATDAK